MTCPPLSPCKWMLGAFLGVALGAGPALAVVATPASVLVVPRPGSHWVDVEVAIPRQTALGDSIPRASLIGVAQWLSSSSSETDGHFGALRARGGRIAAESTVDGLVVSVAGPARDATLVVDTALSMVGQFTFLPGALDASLRQLRRRAGERASTLDALRTLAWRAAFARPAPRTTLRQGEADSISAEEVEAAALALPVDRAVFIIEAPEDALAINGVSAIDVVAQKRRAALEAAHRSSSSVLPLAPQLPRPPLPHAGVVAPAEFLLAHPLAATVAHDPLVAGLLRTQLELAIFGALASTPRVWIESSAAASLLMIHSTTLSPDDIRQNLERWQASTRITRSQLATADDLADLEAKAEFDIGATAHLWARRVLRRPSGPLAMTPESLDAARVREVLEELPLHVFPAQLRVFATPVAP